SFPNAACAVYISVSDSVEGKGGSVSSCHDYRYLSVYLYLFYPSDSFSSRSAEALYSENLRRFMADPHAAVLSAQYNVYLSTPSCDRDPVYSRGNPQNMFQCL